MKYCYSNLGDGMRSVSEDYEPIEGEVVSDIEWPTEKELRAMFPMRLAAQQAAMAGPARDERNRQLREIYDIGLQIVRREMEMTDDSERLKKLIAKRTELHDYANLLLVIPEQTGFPVKIVWPVQPNMIGV